MKMMGGGGGGGGGRNCEERDVAVTVKNQIQWGRWEGQ